MDRPPYKSWRKKYRKMHAKFTAVLDENKRLFKDEQKLKSIAHRLREELDGLLELCLDLNQSPALPADLRFDISLPVQHTAVGTIPSVVDADITPSAANDMFAEYTSAVQRGQIPHLDLHVIREQLDAKLRLQGVRSLDDLERSVSHTRPDLDGGALPDEVLGDSPPGLLSSEQEDAYLARLDAKLGNGDPLNLSSRLQEGSEEKHWAEMTAREVERQCELLNPQSQHNWLKNYATKNGGETVDDTESLADAKPARKRNLAKQVGDRAVGRAREGGGGSPSVASHGGEEDELGMDDHLGPSSSRKKVRDADTTYRVKGGKSNSGTPSASASKNKRKRPASGVDGEGSNMLSVAKKSKYES